MNRIESKFIGNFKVGDNINYNLRVLTLLYRKFAEETDENKLMLCKPIVVLNVSIIDAVLHDLHFRIRTFTNEGVRNILNKSRDEIRQLKKIEKLEAAIKSAKKHGLIEPAGAGFYQSLDNLRKLRNRVHIQNIYKDPPPDEANAFTLARKLEAEQAVEKTLRVMARKYARDHDHVAAFDLPWDPYYPNE